VAKTEGEVTFPDATCRGFSPNFQVESSVLNFEADAVKLPTFVAIYRIHRRMLTVVNFKVYETVSLRQRTNAHKNTQTYE